MLHSHTGHRRLDRFLALILVAAKIFIEDLKEAVKCCAYETRTFYFGSISDSIARLGDGRKIVNCWWNSKGKGLLDTDRKSSYQASMSDPHLGEEVSFIRRKCGELGREHEEQSNHNSSDRIIHSVVDSYMSDSLVMREEEHSDLCDQCNGSSNICIISQGIRQCLECSNEMTAHSEERMVSQKVAPPAAVKASSGRKGRIPGLRGWVKCGGDKTLLSPADIFSRRASMSTRLSDLRVWALLYFKLYGRKPRVLDTFCGQGGVSHGLALAGFEVKAVDLMDRGVHTLHPAVTFELGDAFDADLSWCDLVWGSPPCQAYSTMPQLAVHQEPSKEEKLIDVFRELCVAAGKPFIIENVMGARDQLVDPIGLCGSTFGLEVIRHRLFELGDLVLTNHELVCDHTGLCLGAKSRIQKWDKHGEPVMCCKGNVWAVYGSPGRKVGSSDERAAAMHLHWMSTKGVSLALPFSYAQYLGAVALRSLCSLAYDDVPESVWDISGAWECVKGTQLMGLAPANKWKREERVEVPPLEAVKGEGGEMSHTSTQEDAAGTAAGTADSFNTVPAVRPKLGGGEASNQWFPSQEVMEQIQYSELGPVGSVRGVNGDSHLMDRHPRGVERRLQCGIQSFLFVVRDETKRRIRNEVERVVEGGCGAHSVIVMLHTTLVPWWMQSCRICEWVVERVFPEVCCPCVDNNAVPSSTQHSLTLLRQRHHTVHLPVIATEVESSLIQPTKEQVSASEEVVRESQKWKPIHLNKSEFIRHGAKQSVLDCLDGCTIDFRGDRWRYELVEQYKFDSTVVWEKTCVEADRMEACGALSHPSQLVRKISSWVVVEKGGKVRVCIDLSTIVNPQIPAWPFTLPKFQDAGEMIVEGSYLAKYDFRDGFFALHLKERDAHLLGVLHPRDQSVRVCSRLPFGLSWSPAWFCQMTEEVASLMRGLGVKCIIFVDDLLIAGDTLEECEYFMSVVERVFADLGIQWAEHKKEGPAQRLEFLGAELDTRPGHMCFRVPPKKLVKCLALIEGMFVLESEGMCEAKTLASLIGKLAWCSVIVQGGRVFLRRMYDTLAPAFVDAAGRPWVKVGAAPISLDAEFWRDLRWWHKHIVTRNSAPIHPWLSQDATLDVGTDASDEAGGAVIRLGFGAAEVRVDWSEWESVQSSNWRELCMCWWVIDLLGDSLARKRVRFALDNAVSVGIIKNGTSKSPKLMALVRRLYLLSALEDFIVSPWWVQGKMHLRCDGISRGQRPEISGWRVHCSWWCYSQDLVCRPFELIVGGEALYKGVAAGDMQDSPDGKCCWVHPRHDQVAEAIMWVVEASVRDKATCGVLVLPVNPLALWWPMMKHLRVVQFIPSGSHCMEMFSERGWSLRDTRLALMICVFPVMPTMSLIKGRYGAVVARPATRHASLKHERRGTWLVQRMTDGEERDQMLRFPEVPYGLWLYQPISKCSDGVRVNCHLWSKDAPSRYGSGEADLGFKLVQDQKGPFAVRVEDCYVVTPWVADKDDKKKGKVRFDHHQWLRLYGRGAEVSDVSTPILAEAFGARNRELSRLSQAPNSLPPSPSVFPSLPSMTRVSELAASSTTAGRFESRCHGLLERGGFPFSLQLPLQKKQWWTELFAAVREMEECDLLSQLTLLMADAAASYVVEIFTEYAASGLTSLQLAKEDQLLSRMMNLMGANQVDQLPSQISMLVEMRSSVQLTGDEMSGDVSLVWVLPYFFREHCRMQGLSMDATQSYTDNEETQPLPEVSRAHSSHDSLGDPGSTGGSQQGVIRSPAASVDGSQQSSIQRGWYDVAAESLSESQMCGRKWQFGTQDDAISVAASSQATVPDSQHHSSPILLSSGSAMSIEDMQDHIEATQSMAKDVECVKESPRPSWRAGCSRASMLVICERGVLVVKGMAESVTDEARGYWTLPGGKVRVGESFKEAAVRKWEEEVGFPLEETVVSFATTVGVTSYYWCTLNASDAAAELADGFASRASKKAIVGWRWHSLVWVASILKSRGGLVDDSTQRESLLWGKDWAFDDVIATEKVVSMMVVNRSAPGGSKESSNLAGRDPDSGPIPMSPQRDLGALPVIPVLMSPPTIMLPPMIHRASNNQGADALRAPSGSYVLCNLPGRCPDCDQPLTLGHPIIKRVPPGMDSARWCHVICRLAGTPPASAALLEDERFPDTPPLQLTYEQKQFSRDAQWIELRFVETIGDWLEPSAKIIEHRYLQSLVAHYGDSVEWEMQGSNLHLGETSVQEWLWERETIVASQAQAPSSIVLYAAASTTDRLWVTDWASLHGSDVFWSWAVHEETMPLESGSGACDMLVPSMSGVGGVKPLTSREQRWIEGHQCGGLRQATHLACWNVPDCGGVLAGVVGHIVCVECEATAHFQCLGVPPPAVSGEQREVTCPNCLIAKCTKNPTDVFRTAMANITLSAAGNDSTNNEKKERKTLVNAVTKYEEEHNLYPSTVLTVPEAGVAFLQSYASAGHVPQMRKMRKAMKRWLGEKKLHDWTEESLAHFILGATAKKLTKGSEQAHKIDRAIIKTAHILLKQKVLAGAMSILVATRTNAGSHCIFGASTRASEISGTDVDHGANTGGVRLGKRKEKLIVTPHAAGAVRGEPRELQCSWFDLEVEDSKMDPGKAVVSVAGETCRRRLEEYAEAWGRSWVTIDNPDTSGDKVEVMDYKVLRVGLSGVVPGTPAGEAFLSALVDTQRAYCFETRFKSEVMLRWLANTARARAQHPDSNKRWINVVDGTISSLERNAKNYAHLLQECYNQKMRTLYLTSEGKQGYAVQAPLIDTAVRWGPLFTNTTGHFSRLQITPMPLSGDSMEKDLKAIWGEACMVLGRGELHPSSHGGRGGACLLARSLAAQAGIDPASMREYVDSHFRWSPEKDRMQILYSGHLPRSERLKITSLFWPVGTEWDY